MLADKVSRFADRLSFTDRDFSDEIVENPSPAAENKLRSTLRTLSLPCGIRHNLETNHQSALRSAGLDQRKIQPVSQKV